MEDKSKFIDAEKLVDEYIKKVKWQIKENANFGYSFSSIFFRTAGEVMEKYTLSKIYPKNIAQAHMSGDLHLHNLYMGIVGYCAGWSIKDILFQGFNGIPGKIEAKPPRHLSTALLQLANFVGSLQNEWAGAQAFNSLDTLLAPYVRIDKLNYKQVKQQIQQFIWNLNISSRWGGQTPFTNITFDLDVPEDLKDEHVIYAGELLNRTYADYQEEMNMINKAFFEIMSKGDMKERAFTFPLPTYNLTKDFEWESEISNLLFEMTAKYGIPYFQNFISSNLNPREIRSMCCHLSLDLREFHHRLGGFFGYADKTGCYDEKTEVLTKGGWKSFKDLTKEDEVLTLNPQTREIEYQTPVRIFEYDYDGEMIKITSNSLDLLVTPNHNMFIERATECSSKKYKQMFCRADELDPNRDRIPKTGEWHCAEVKEFVLPGISANGKRTPSQVLQRIKMDNWLKFLGIYLAGGSVDNGKIAKQRYRVFISQTDKRKRKEIREMLNELPFNYSENEEGFVIYNKQLWTYLRSLGDKHHKFIPKEFKQLPPEQLNILLNWMVMGDGNKCDQKGRRTRRFYWTTSERLADDIQELLLKVGSNGQKSIDKKKTDRCLISEHVSKNCYLRYKSFIDRVRYRGKVYCCEVPNHVMYVRRNGKAVFCGNSVGVVTINMPRIGYLSKNEDEFFERLERLMNLGKESLEIKRKLVQENIDKGLLPFSKRYLGTLKFHFSTIGLLGMNEACLNFLDETIATEEGKKFSIKVLKFMREKIREFQEETKHIYNLEATPAEGSLAPDEKIIVSSSSPQLTKIGPLVDKFINKNRSRVKEIGNSEILKLPQGKLFTYGFDRETQIIKKYPVTAVVRHKGKSMYEIITKSGRRVKVTGQHSLFGMDDFGLPREIKVRDLKEGMTIAVPKRIRLESNLKEFNLVEEFKGAPFGDHLYLKTTKRFVSSLLSMQKVKRWIKNNYETPFKNIKILWKKRNIIPLRVIWDCKIKPKRDILEKSLIFYRKTRNTNPIKALIKLNRELGFVLGCLLSEGWIAQRSKFSNTDERYARKFSKACKNVFGRKSSNLRLERREKKKDLFIVRLSKMTGLLFDWVFRLSGKSYEKSIPRVVFEAPEELVVGLIEGFELGDGNRYFNEDKRDYRIRFSSTSERLIEGLNILLLKLGILTKLKLREKSKWGRDEHVLVISGVKNLKKYFDLIEKDFSLDLKETNSGKETIPRAPRIIKEILRDHDIKPKNIEIWKDSPNRNVRISVQSLKKILKGLDKLEIEDERLTKLKLILESDIFWDEIKTIRKLKAPKYVYDLEVEVEDGEVNNFLGGYGLVCLHNTSYRLAKIDKKRYPNIRTAGEKTPYYTNSTFLPVDYTDDLFEALKHQEDLQVLYNGGTVFHGFLGERLTSGETCKLLVKKIAENFRIPYYTITPTFSICPDHGYLKGEHFKCPKCGKGAEVYSRVVGYLRPVQNWNPGKREEFRQRKEYSEKRSVSAIGGI